MAQAPGPAGLTLKLDCVAWSFVQAGFENFRGWKFHDYSKSICIQRLTTPDFQHAHPHGSHNAHHPTVLDHSFLPEEWEEMASHLVQPLYEELVTKLVAQTGTGAEAAAFPLTPRGKQISRADCSPRGPPKDSRTHLALAAKNCSSA